MKEAAMAEVPVADASVVGPTGGEVIQLGPIRMRILEDGHTTDHRLGIGEITIAPHTDGPPQHRHARHDEGFYVVSGAARFTVGDRSHDAPAGTFVMVPPGAPHTFANPGDEPAVLLNTFTPDLYVQYFRDLRDMVAEGHELSTAATVEAMSRYATVPAGDFPPSTKEIATMAAVHPISTPHAHVDLAVSDEGQGRPFLFLHGGAGLDSVAGFAARFAAQRPARVIAPVPPRVRRHRTAGADRQRPRTGRRLPAVTGGPGPDRRDGRRQLAGRLGRRRAGPRRR
jgi:mannose-6-phosphate isomerase-like protein (cupin superfamily)